MILLCGQVEPASWVTLAPFANSFSCTLQDCISLLISHNDNLMLQSY